MSLIISLVSLFLLTTVATSNAKPLQQDTLLVQLKDDFPREEKYMQAETLLTDKDEGLSHLPSTFTDKSSIEGKTKKLNFRMRIGKPTILSQTNSVKTIGAALLKSAVHHTRAKPFCGVSDPPTQPNTLADRLLRRHRRYVLEGSSLTGPTITWNVPSNSWSTKLSNSDVKATLTKAFRRWAEVTPLVFRWVDESVPHDITIKFATGPHGDQSPFDGPGGELAHAYYPKFSSDIHFDDSEAWTRDSPSPSKSLFRVAVHEIGHSLGLKHSTVSGSIMNAFYKDSSSTEVTLHADDIAGAQKIYGMCALPSLDAIESSMYDYKTYAFKDDLLWQFDDQSSSTVPNYPKSISEWTGIPSNLDDVLLWGWNWHLYFFKGSDYYRYDGNQVLSGYPRKIRDGWQGIPDDIDAAFSVSSDVTYFLKGDQVYRFDNYYDQLESGYPQKISNIFPGAPNDIDTAFRWYYDGQVYFFKGEYFYKWIPSDGLARGPYNTQLEWKNLCHV